MTPPVRAAISGGLLPRLTHAVILVTPHCRSTPDELSHQYLWRFWKALPRTGHFGIFDRTWYGRVLVERVEGFTPVSRINQAYNEINEFEYMLHRWGAIIFKFGWQSIRTNSSGVFEEREIPLKSSGRLHRRTGATATSGIFIRRR